MAARITKQADEYLDSLAKALEIPPSRYEQAERSYKAIGEWLHREESVVAKYDPEVFVQGSFKLGTAIRPVSSSEEYDVDCACSLRSLTKSDLSQADLKELVGKEVKLYRKSKGISKEVHSGQRCWRLEYSDGAQFHMDIVPCLPNGASQRSLLEARGLDATFSDSAIAITDNELPGYPEVTDEWPRSNPKGYAKWFESRMGDVFDRRRRQVLNEMRRKDVTASIEDIPTYRVRTPLQSAIMILKRHRDMMFKDDPKANPKDKPISIIISTLAAYAYSGEETIGDALVSILTGMEDAIQHDGRTYIILNPTDPLENFADKWEKHPERARAFEKWLARARNDFATAAEHVEYEEISNILESRIGRELTETVNNAMLQTSNPGRGTLLRSATAASTSAPPIVSFADSEARVPKKPDGFA
jgi:hypothetical protein